MTKHNSILPVAKSFIIKYNTYIIFLLLFVVCTLMSDNFLTMMNLRNIALQQAPCICIGLGMLLVILTGGIDLSVGSIMAFGASLSAYLITFMDVNFIVAMLISLLASSLLGLFTGILVSFFRFQGFVASLSMMTIASGLAFIITQGTPIRLALDTMPLIAHKDYYYPMLIITVLIIITFLFMEKYTSFGRLVKAIGSNAVAVNLAGINIKFYLIIVYMVSSVLAGLAGMFVAARSNTGLATIGVGKELEAIAACVIGGASLAGGRGETLKTVTGALILALIGNIMNLMAIPSYPQDVIKGLIIVVAVMFQMLTDKRNNAI
ncbi:MAG: ABC transporter permease [Burkholderiales bacterium]